MKKGLLAFLTLATIQLYGQKTQVSILVDPGHGGKDPGHLPTNSAGVKEKELTLKIAMKVGYYLTNNLANVVIDYTRTDDSYPTLDERVEMANSGKYDYMLSVHVNGSPNPSSYGTESLIHNYDSKVAHSWAKLVEDQFKQRAGRKSRGVKTSDDLGHSLQILKFTKIPTVIVECGFITNGSEYYYLTTDYGQDIIASAIFRATREFVKSQYPDIDFMPKPSEETPKPIEDEESKPYYRVQIMASIEPVDTNNPQFKNLDYEVDRVEIETNSAYKYRYYIGKFSDKKEAKTVRKDVQSKGFEDAFVALVE